MPSFHITRMPDFYWKFSSFPRSRSDPSAQRGQFWEHLWSSLFLLRGFPSLPFPLQGLGLSSLRAPLLPSFGANSCLPPSRRVPKGGGRGRGARCLRPLSCSGCSSARPAPAAPSSLRLSTPSACPPLLSSFGEVLLTVPGFGPFYSFCTVYVAPSCNRCCGKGDTRDLSH